MFIIHGANLTQLDSQGNSALDLAIEWNKPKCVEELVIAGAKPRSSIDRAPASVQASFGRATCCLAAACLRRLFKKHHWVHKDLIPLISRMVLSTRNRSVWWQPFLSPNI